MGNENTNTIISPLDVKFNTFKRKVNISNEEKALDITGWISTQLDLEQKSAENGLKKLQHEKLFHPIRPMRGEIFMAEIGINVGVEFNSYHPVLVLQNDTGNTFSETTIVLPITELEKGEKLDRNIHQIITNKDLQIKHNRGLDKDPSKVKLSDILTIDKARLNTKIGKVKPKFMKIIETKMCKLLGFTLTAPK